MSAGASDVEADAEWQLLHGEGEADMDADVVDNGSDEAGTFTGVMALALALMVALVAVLMSMGVGGISHEDEAEAEAATLTCDVTLLMRKGVAISRAHQHPRQWHTIHLLLDEIGRAHV